MQNVTFLAFENESTEQPIMMSSREIAKLTCKNHTNVGRDIRSMLSALYGSEDKDYIRKSDLIYVTNQGVDCVHYDTNNPNAWEYLLDRRHTEILVTGYDVKRRAAVIDRWFALESGSAVPAVQIPQFSVDDLVNNPKLLLEIIGGQSQNLLLKDQTIKEVSEERDEAIRTKAQISQKREAKALQRNSAYQRVANRAIREREEMAARFGASKEWASQQAVWRATGIMYGWKVLNAWLDENNIYDPVTDGYPMAYNIYQNCHEVIYPLQAWLEVHGVDISELF
ncbi:Rha family transcriptional regulator [Xenorhabdus sp. SGI240]|uniref:Rha family transcriptional regulator n=1 Tax=Xenorhabdus sp. SGI240 TaxID=3158262 RepID=UPI0032B70B55